MTIAVVNHTCCESWCFHLDPIGCFFFLRMLLHSSTLPAEVVKVERWIPQSRPELPMGLQQIFDINLQV